MKAPYLSDTLRHQPLFNSLNLLISIPFTVLHQQQSQEKQLSPYKKHIY